MFGSPRGGRTGRGAYGKPQRPEGRRGLPDAPLGGAGRMFGSPRGGAREGVRAAAPRPQGGRLPLAPLGGAGRIFGSPLGGAREGVRTASPYRPVGRQGLTGRAPGWGGGKLQQARLLCPRITGAKGVNLVDMRY